MKLFVWTDVLTDCTSGMIVALAPDLETAIAKIRQDADSSMVEKEARDNQPQVIDLAENGDNALSWHVWGGG